MSAAKEASTMYRIAMAATSPVVRWWGRLEVSGLENLPESGPVLLAGNHDSYWDPISIGIAGLPRRQICALAKSELWKVPLLDHILNGMGQIPIDRGAGDAHALDRAAAELEKGRCIGVFLEGTRSRGSELRARSGFGRLAERVPDAQIVSCTVEGTTDVIRFPKRPQIKVRFFKPAGGGKQADETPTEFGTRLLAEIRGFAPVSALGRRQRAAQPVA